MIFYELCLIKAKDKQRFKIHLNQKPNGPFIPLPKWLENEINQIYTNIQSARYNLYNLQTRLRKEGFKYIVCFELLQGEF